MLCGQRNLPRQCERLPRKQQGLVVVQFWPKIAKVVQCDARLQKWSASLAPANHSIVCGVVLFNQNYDNFNFNIEADHYRLQMVSGPFSLTSLIAVKQIGLAHSQGNVLKLAKVVDRPMGTRRISQPWTRSLTDRGWRGQLNEEERGRHL